MTNRMKFKQHKHNVIAVNKGRGLVFREAERSKASRTDWTEVFNQWRVHLKGGGTND